MAHSVVLVTGSLETVSRTTALRAAADALRLSLVVGGIVLVATGGVAEGWGVLLAAFTACVVRIVRPPPAVDLAFLSLLSVDVWLTQAGAFEEFNRSDHVGHMLLSAAVMPILFHAIGRYGLAGDATRSRRLALAALGTILLGIAWELVELASDAVLGTDMSLTRADSIGDVLADAAGAVLALIVLSVVEPRTVVGAQKGA